MNIETIKLSINQAVDVYRNKMMAYEETYQITPPIGGWSYSEVYSHILDSSLLSLMALRYCLSDQAENQKTAFKVKVMLFLGFLPPGKFKVPKKLLERVKKINQEEALAFINQFEQELESTYRLVSKADQHLKIKHPRLGYLNAKQWLRFTEIHLKHHLKQLKRIDRAFTLK